MAMRSHAKNFGMPDPERVIATGGASANHHLLRVCADVFGCNVYIASRPGKSGNEFLIDLLFVDLYPWITYVIVSKYASIAG